MHGTALIFADIVGYSTRMKENPDEERPRARQFLDDSRRTVLQYDGLIRSVEGDCIFAVFSSPLNCLECAVNLKKLSEDIYCQPSLHVGLHWSPNMPMDADLNNDINLTQRIQTVCPPGEILASKEFRESSQTQNGLPWLSFGTVPLKGIGERPLSVLCLPKDLSLSDCSSRLNRVALTSLSLLLYDRIPEVGTWGRTIDRYIELNFPRNPDIQAKRHTYKAKGSVTHSAHAMEALASFHIKDNIIAEGLHHYLASIRKAAGTFDPGHVSNPTEGAHAYSLLRHNSTAITSLHFASFLIDQGGHANQLRREALEACDCMARLEILWQGEREFLYSMGYLIQAFTVALDYTQLQNDVVEKIKDHIKKGRLSLFTNVRATWYWCEDSHDETKLFYTLLILLSIEGSFHVVPDAALTQRVCDILQGIVKDCRNAGKVTLSGNGNGSGIHVEQDITCMAMLFLALERYSHIAQRSIELEAAKGLLRGILMFEDYKANHLMTHTWAYLLMICAKFEVRLQYAEIEMARSLVRKQLNEIPENTLGQMLGLANGRDFVERVFLP